MKRSAKKIAVIGAGAVGATLAMRIVERGLGDVVLVDIYKNIACAKALDILDASPIVGHEQQIIGTDDYAQVDGSDIVIITAGLARKPGMTREELAAKNAAIVRDVAEKITHHAPQAIVIVVTNPLDAMTYLVKTVTGFDRTRVIGMAGVLDGSRFCQLIAHELSVPRSSVRTCMLGSHGDTMVPLISQTKVGRRPLMSMLSASALDALVARARDRGAEIVSLLGTGSAYVAPSAAVLAMVEAILRNTRAVMPASVCLAGEYGLSGIAIGVPCMLGRKGIVKVVTLPLTDTEQRALATSAQAIAASIASLGLTS